MRRLLIIWLAGAALWLAGLAVVYDPFDATARLGRHGSDAADTPGPLTGYDWYRDPDAVQADAVRRQRSAVAQSYVADARERLGAFLPLAILPPLLALAMAIALRTVFEDTITADQRVARRRARWRG